MTYVDGFVLTVPKRKLSRYKKDATWAKKAWLKHGALGYYECIADDMKPKWVTFTFPKMAKAKPNEVVFFSFITYRNRKHRDSVNKKVMAEMEAYKEQHTGELQDMPFDMKRMAYGGFKGFVEGTR